MQCSQPQICLNELTKLSKGPKSGALHVEVPIDSHLVGKMQSFIPTPRKFQTNLQLLESAVGQPAQRPPLTTATIDNTMHAVSTQPCIGGSTEWVVSLRQILGRPCYCAYSPGEGDCLPPRHPVACCLCCSPTRLPAAEGTNRGT